MLVFNVNILPLSDSRDSVRGYIASIYLKQSIENATL